MGVLLVVDVDRAPEGWPNPGAMVKPTRREKVSGIASA
jgi:hypothetical protein